MVLPSSSSSSCLPCDVDPVSVWCESRLRSFFKVLRGGLFRCSLSSWSSPRGGEAEGGVPFEPELVRDGRRLV
ncbi:hypothetical protein IG631_10970 [Alternaria alternata]|nr:hypothetical protein IG631_10970 [Alternaria alternata]